jgi:hypothetical protein
MSSLNIWKKSAGVDNRVHGDEDSLLGAPTPAYNLRYLLNLIKGRFHADPDPDPTFHFLCLSRSGSYTQLLRMLKKADLFFIHGSASLHCLSFLVRS